MSRYRFLATPRWIFFHVLVLVLIVVMINLALWQLRRLDERKAFNQQVRTRSAAPAQELDRVVPAGTTVDGARPQEWKTVQMTGTFDPSTQVLIRNRSFNGAPGFDVVTPLERAGDDAVLVLRGWVPLTTSNSALPDVPAPPAGTVTVTGWVRPTQNPGRFESRDPSTGVLTTLARVDIPRIAQQTPYPIAPVYVELTSPAPPANALPVPEPLPTLDNGPHLGYAVQWCIFSACAVIGWVLVVRKSRRARDQHEKEAAKAAATARAASEPNSPVDAVTPADPDPDPEVTSLPEAAICPGFRDNS
jgi:cytochrome oxidase assembly protein ShyY1